MEHVMEAGNRNNNIWIMYNAYVLKIKVDKIRRSTKDITTQVTEHTRHQARNYLRNSYVLKISIHQWKHAMAIYVLKLNTQHNKQKTN